MTMLDALRSAPLFAGLSDGDLERLISGASEETRVAGSSLFEEGDEGDRACLILEGELEVVKKTGHREVLLAVRGVGEVIGEMALLDAAPRMATVRAKTDVRLISIPKQQMDDLLATSATAARSLFGGLLSRWRETEARLRQSERMAQIGTLTAGLAHEMNNPAAAVTRAAGQMTRALDRLATANEQAASTKDHPRLAELLAAVRLPPEPMSTLVQSDREAEIEDLLSDHGIVDGWRVAPEIVAAGISATTLGPALADVGDGASAAIELIAATAETGALLREMEEGSSRLSAIVAALKSYSHLDQADVREVDIHRGIEDTLLILKSKLGDIGVRRDYADEEVRAETYAAELNQVWTNLIDNAVDAVSDVVEPVIVIRTGTSNEAIQVDVEDNGSGIPAELQDRIFDAFFTTKPPGFGTGLGLDITRSIVVDRHQGEISFESEPGRTVFRVSIPKRYSAGLTDTSS